MEQETEKYYDLIITFLSGNLHPGEEQALLDWRRTSTENEVFFQKIRDVWFATSQVKQPNLFDEDVAINNIHHKILSESNRNFGRIKDFKKYLKIAATWIVIFSLGASVNYLFNREKTSANNQLIRMVTPKGSRSMAYLPDGTMVWLNAGSELTYKIGSGKNREITLVGEAFFKVKPDHKHPFIVMANGISVKALGTSFNVKAYPEEKKITTTLVEGKVNIEKPGVNGSKPTIISMHPKQKVVIFNDNSSYIAEKLKLNDERISHKENAVVLEEKQSIPAIKAQNINTELYTSWKDERWIIDGEEFGNLATLLERRYNVKIMFSTDELKKYRFSGTFTNETIEQALLLMRYTLPFSFSIEKNSILLKVDPELQRNYNQAYGK